MTEREKMAQIIAEHLCPQGRAHKTLYGAARRCYSRNNFADCEKVSECVDALIAANIGDVTEWKHRSEVAEKDLERHKRALRNAVWGLMTEGVYGFVAESEAEFEKEIQNELEQAEREIEEEKGE